jgi:hypothetical protein
MRKALPEPIQSQISVLTHDASESGIAMVHRESPDVILHSGRKRFADITAATFAEQLDAQVLREALGGWITFDIYRRRRNVSWLYPIVQN